MKSALQMAHKLGLDGPGCYIIAYNGGQIYDIHADKMIFSASIPLDLVRVCFDQANTFEINIQAYASEDVLVERLYPDVERYCRIQRLNYRIVEDVCKELPGFTPKMLVTDMDHEPRVHEFRDILAPLVDGKADIFLSQPTYLEIVPPGTIGAPLLPKLAEELGCPDCRYIHTVEFDASAAMVSAPGLTKDSIYLSMGSTINPGVLLKQPVISDAALEYRYKNAPVWPGSVMLMSDVPGFFILQECLDLWKKSDPSLGHGELVKLAEASCADAVVDLFDPRFSTTKDNMPACIRECCRETGQNVPETIGDVARVLYLSYAAAVAWSLDKLKMITGKNDYREIIAVSGGSRNALLCQMIADASGMTVRAGDPKATCLGNLLVQFYALGKLDSYEAMQAEAADFCEMKTYTPVTGK